MSHAIEIRNLTKRYGRLTAVDGVSLDVADGEVYGLIGPDGAGKSTVYKILATLLRADSGTVSIFGLDPMADRSQLRKLIGYMPERFSLYPDLTVKENLNFFASLFGLTVAENYDLIAPVFGQLERFPDRLAGRLSGGMKQKLALSCALIHQPRILLLDEPTTGVDAVSRSEFWDMLGGLRRQGITIVVSTSYMDEAMRCERISMLDHGHILTTGTPRQLIDNLGERLYNAAARDMFGLLSALRQLPEVADCYTFGATLHVVAGEGFDADRVEEQLHSLGIADAKIFPAQGDIEDLFIKLTRNDNRHCYKS